jgi:hypothetical protein
MTCIKIGFDVGGVILDQTTRELITESYKTIKLCIEKYKPENVFIVSKARNHWIDLTKQMFIDTQFYEFTNFLDKNIYFVDEYEDKAIMCEKLQINYFVDDSVKVIKFLLDTDTKGIWYNPSCTSCLTKTELKKIHIVKTWKNIRKLLLT